MARPDDDSQKTKFIDALRLAGGASGNTSLMYALGWSEQEYWRLREKLLEDGQIKRGRGRGGSVILVEEEPSVETELCIADDIAPAVEHFAKESDFYAPCLKVLRENWTLERNLHDVYIEITASQGGKRTGGIWTRPDISAISMRTFSHWPGRVFDIWTFEIKPPWQFNVTGVFEAAAHARSATHSYAMYATPQADPVDDADITRLVSEAQRVGVGLILFDKPDDFRTWDIKVDPIRHEPDPELLEEFVVTQLSPEARGKLLRWGK